MTKASPSVLVTGFQPFGGQTVNPSWLAVSRLPGEIGHTPIHCAELPVKWFAVLDCLEALAEQYRPDILLLTGQAGGRDALCLERVGINLCEAKGADNDGLVLQDTPIFPEGPAAYFSNLPYRKMKEALDRLRIPNRYSFSAGAYLCNHVLYGALHLGATRFPEMKSLFLHVPYLPEQVEKLVKAQEEDAGGERSGPVPPSMPLETIAKGMEAVLAAAIAQWREEHTL